jgi:hypothetical protein
VNARCATRRAPRTRAPCVLAVQRRSRREPRGVRALSSSSFRRSGSGTGSSRDTGSNPVCALPPRKIRPLRGHDDFPRVPSIRRRRGRRGQKPASAADRSLVQPRTPARDSRRSERHHSPPSLALPRSAATATNRRSAEEHHGARSAPDLLRKGKGGEGRGSWEGFPGLGLRHPYPPVGPLLPLDSTE